MSFNQSFFAPLTPSMPQPLYNIDGTPLSSGSISASMPQSQSMQNLTNLNYLPHFPPSVLGPQFTSSPQYPYILPRSASLSYRNPDQSIYGIPASAPASAPASSVPSPESTPSPNDSPVARSNTDFYSSLPHFGKLSVRSAQSSRASSPLLTATRPPSSSTQRKKAVHKKKSPILKPRRNSVSSSAIMRTPPPTTMKLVDSVTGKTKYTQPAQGALRMNKFVQRLHTALKIEYGNDTVSWKKGCLVLHSTETFATDILPKYFKTNNFKTFRRQLNYYGFVHARSFANETGSGTTALWVNQELAQTGSESIDSVLLLKRVDAAPSAKTVNGRRMRKEGAIDAIGLESDGDVSASKIVEEVKNEPLITASPPLLLNPESDDDDISEPDSPDYPTIRYLNHQKESLLRFSLENGGVAQQQGLPVRPQPVLSRSYTPETEVLARCLMSLGGSPKATRKNAALNARRSM